MIILKVLSLFLSLYAVAAYPQFAKHRSLRPASYPRRPVLTRAAAPYSPQYNYTGATLNGQPGTGVGGIHVPAPGDVAHFFEDPPPGAYRGPCPGLNTLANHGFLSRDGITTYTELIAALQNVYNLEWSSAVVLTVLGIALDGDPLTEMLSIGNDATYKTGVEGEYTGFYGGLCKQGTFQLDVSLTRTDFYLHGDACTFNATMFKMMTDTVASTSSVENPLFDLAGLSLYRSQLYEIARETNPYLYFPPLSLHSYGAATFLYNTFATPSRNSSPDLPTISSFFGAVPLPDGSFASQPERIPANWTNQPKALTLNEIGTGIDQMFAAYPKEFGSNYGLGNWVSLGNASQSTGALSACAVVSAFQGAVELAPDPLATAEFVYSKMYPVFGSVCNFTIESLMGIY